MKKNKRKNVVSANTSYKRPRSSLKVNLSCASNLTDSGNDSLDFDVNSSTSSGIPLKNASIVLERIDVNKENTNKLLNVSIKSGIRTNHLSNSESKNKSCTKIEDSVEKIKRKNGKNNTSQSICNTPKTTCQNRNLRKTSLRVLKKIQSYDLKEHLDVSDKNINSKSYTSKELVQLRNRISNENDPMLMKIGEMSCSKEMNNHIYDSSIICRNRFSQASISSISENGFTAVPICCSTMIDGNMSDEENDENPAQVSIQKVSNNNCEFNHLIELPQQVSNKLEGQSVHDKETIVIESDSVNTVRTSLNVNTSIDVIDSKNSSKRKAKNYENGSIKNKRKNEYSTVSNLIQESTNTVRTSLQMNTSYTSNQLQNNTNIDAIRISTTESIKIIDICDSDSTRKNNLDDQKINSRKRQCQDEVTSEKIDNSKCNENGTSTSSSIINQSTDKIETENNENLKDSMIVPNTKRHKRKLLPLHEGSQLASFSPIEDECPFPRPVIFRKQFINKGKNNKSNSKKNNKSNSGNTGERSMIKEKNNHNEKEKTQRKPRKVISKKIIVKKIAEENILKKLSKNRMNCSKAGTANVCTPNGSPSDFQSWRILKKKRTKKLYIVTTGLSNEDKSLVKRVVRSLGSAKIEPNVTKNTTHVVTTGVRTINLLHGIIRGCWLVGLEWVLKSLESKEWLIPEDYEMAHFSKAVSENRKDRQLFGKSYTPELFTACGLIYIENSARPPSDGLKDLVKAGGGCITENPEEAKILIGSGGLKETWILDCIMSGELQPYNQYQRS